MRVLVRYRNSPVGPCWNAVDHYHKALPLQEKVSSAQRLKVEGNDGGTVGGTNFASYFISVQLRMSQVTLDRHVGLFKGQ